MEEKKRDSGAEFATVAQDGGDGKYVVVYRHRKAKAAHRVAKLRSTRKRPLFAARLAPDGSISEILGNGPQATGNGNGQAKAAEPKADSKPRITVELRDAKGRLINLADRLEDLAGKVRAVAGLEDELREVFGAVFAEIRTLPNEVEKAA